MTHGERMRRLQGLARAERRLAAEFAELLDVMDVEGDHVPDGHRSIRNLLVAVGNLDHASAGLKVREMKTLRLMPEVRSSLAAGDFSVAHLRSLAHAYGNPRARDFLPALEPQVMAWADWEHDEFDHTVRDVVRLIDAEGSEQKDRLRHDRRHLHHSKVGDGFAGSYGCGPVQGAVIQRVLDHFASKEFDADWTEATARLGDRITKHDLGRTDEQRRMDALQAMALAAASVTPGLRAPQPLVNIVFDARTMDETIEWATTGIRPAPDLTDVASRRCQTSDGVRIPPSDALTAMWQGHVRRMVVDEHRVTIDLGRRRRLYTGAARDAVMLRSVRCVWPGCHIAASHSQADHTVPWSHDGPTDAAAGAVKCGHHNRWSTRGFTTTTDDRGHFHTLRPDGTTINAPPAE